LIKFCKSSFSAGFLTFFCRFPRFPLDSEVLRLLLGVIFFASGTWTMFGCELVLKVFFDRVSAFVWVTDCTLGAARVSEVLIAWPSFFLNC
jgi:hypothetical protein